ncbi:hypothetical protein BHE74_00058461 [Ensete ventricosum]|nr:hypothetical protein BHE74_00058461 [Ensete ventricosum]
MSEPRCHSPRSSASPTLMDLDLDLDGSPWTFDPSPLVASRPSSFLLSSSSPVFFPPPPSPLWIFEDSAAGVSSALADGPAFFKGNHDVRNVKANMTDGKAKVLHVPAVEGFSDGSCVIKERMTQALRYFKESTDHHVLVQVWAPVKNGDRCVLTTLGQPFILDPQSTKLLQYRTVSLMYIFSVDEDDDADLGLPGRVFTRRMPEWTPNVQYYSSKEYQRLNHALCYNVKGTLALPVFEPSAQSCIGVVEVVMTSQKVNYAYEVDKVCKALEIANDGHQAALAEILEILTLVCESKKWPSRKINKVNRSLSKLKHVIESVQGAGALDLTSLPCPLLVAVDSVPWPVDLDSLKDLQDGVKRSEFSPEKPCDREDQQDQSVSLQIHVKEQVGPQLNPVKDSRRSTRSSSEGSMDAPTSRGSCQGSPVNNFFVSSQPALSDLNQAQGTTCSPKLTLQNARNWSLLNEKSLPIAVNSKPQLPVEVLIKDSGSSKGLKIHCTIAGVGSRDEPAMILTRDTSQPWVSQETKALTIKASYKEDIIRFRLPHNAGILALKDEISKKLKLEVGTFDIKYLDDDHEWVLLTCDWDLEECLDVSRSSGTHIIRLSVHDTVTNLGSSCESSVVDYHNYVTR